MKLSDVLKEAVNLGRTDSFPVFLNGKATGRIYLVPSDDIEWLSQGKLEDSESYSVFVKGLEPEKFTDENFKYYAFKGDDIEELNSEDKQKLASSFGRAFGYFEPVRYSRHK